jgi:hypothetical protein
MNPAPENPQPSKVAVQEATPILHEASHREFFLQNKLAVSQIRTVGIAFAGISIQSSGMALSEGNQVAEFERLFPEAICNAIRQMRDRGAIQEYRAKLGTLMPHMSKQDDVVVLNRCVSVKTSEATTSEATMIRQVAVFYMWNINKFLPGAQLYNLLSNKVSDG